MDRVISSEEVVDDALVAVSVGVKQVYWYCLKERKAEQVTLSFYRDWQTLRPRESACHDI